MDGVDLLLRRGEVVALVGENGSTLARILTGLYRPTGGTVVVFRRPTSALDAHDEAAAFDRVADLAGRGRAILLISHRLASVRRADRIYVLSRGRFIEHGAHDELMANGGEYATAYRLQAAQYA